MIVSNDKCYMDFEFLDEVRKVFEEYELEGFLDVY